MISAEERRKCAAQHGVPEQQIVRDHLISHVLNALCSAPLASLTFFGGTALCRTWCADTRLSEDIDLLVDDHVQAANDIPKLISRGIRRDFPVVRWIDAGRKHEVDTKILEVDRSTSVKIQFARWRTGWRALPSEPTPVRLRYSDLPDHTVLQVPSATAFVVMKLIAWGDRHAPRDLFDLYALAKAGHFVPEVHPLFHELTGCLPRSVVVRNSIPRGVLSSWQAELGHQASDVPEPTLCLESVLEALESLTS